MKDTARSHGLNISVSTIASALTVGTMVWFLVKPAVVKAVGEELDTKMEQVVSAAVAPTNAALAIILSNGIDNLKLQIAAMEFERDFPPEGDWSDLDARELARLKNTLSTNQAALSALEGNDTS